MSKNDQKYPILQEGLYSVLVNEFNTGIILNTSFNRYKINNNEEQFWVFENIDKAYKFIKTKLAVNNGLEFSIYDHTGKYIKGIHKDNYLA